MLHDTKSHSLCIKSEVGTKDRVWRILGTFKDSLIPTILVEKKIINQKLGPRTVPRGFGNLKGPILVKNKIPMRTTKDLPPTRGLSASTLIVEP